MSVNIQPLKDYVLAKIETTKAETKTASGFYLPPDSQKKEKTATVAAVGKDVKDLKANDKIIYIEGFDNGLSTATAFEVGKDEYVLVNEKYVIATTK